MYVQTNGIDQVVVLRGQRLVAHNLKDGRELWRMTGMPPFPICTPVVVGDRLFVSAADEFGESDKIVVMSVRLDGNGDVTNTHNG